MEKNYFDVVSENVSESVKNKGFKCSKSANECLLKKDDNEYKIMYKEDSKTVLLETADKKGKYKNISSWSLNSDNIKQKDIDMICEDFVQSIAGVDKRVAKRSRVKTENEESNIDSLFFANRMASIFPELKEEVRVEKECYSEFRGATFTKDKIVPLVKGLLAHGKDKSKMQKLFKVLGDLYESGTLDVRSIITMVVLNNIEDEKQIETAEKLMSEKLKRAWHASRKYKGKKVKPEKVKKRSNFISKTLMDK